mmetsp:Transcript_15698/g.49144  ORF Transcript_15698/g.49144 Transcript_15698/m.49144 type:complete len:339 (-) Transcript_15698:145-1161(-)
MSQSHTSATSWSSGASERLGSRLTAAATARRTPAALYSTPSNDLPSASTKSGHSESEYTTTSSILFLTALTRTSYSPLPSRARNVWLNAGLRPNRHSGEISLSVAARNATGSTTVVMSGSEVCRSACGMSKWRWKALTRLAQRASCVRSGTSSVKLATRARTLATPLDANFSLDTVSRSAMRALSTLRSKVPWWQARLDVSWYALPLTLRPSRRQMSFLPRSSARTPTSSRAATTIAAFVVRSKVAASVMRVKLVLPSSWYTAPPPEARRTKKTPLSVACPCTDSSPTFVIFTSLYMFWLRPRTIVGPFLHRNSSGLPTLGPFPSFCRASNSDSAPRL